MQANPECATPESRRPLAGRSAALRAVGVLAIGAALAMAAHAGETGQTRFKRIPIQYVAALSDPGATAGTGAEDWGLWRVDPGPRGVRLSNFDQLLAAGGVAPARWQFDDSAWWLEENGLVMEAPDFPFPPGKYVVTGGREVTSILTVHPEDADGSRRWELSGGATVFDVTHLRCRAARYTPAARDAACSPSRARQSEFPVTPGALMPPVEGCAKQDYAVLFVVGVAVEE